MLDLMLGSAAKHEQEEDANGMRKVAQNKFQSVCLD